MFCTKCGNQLPEDSIFCGKCGNHVLEDQAHEEDKEAIAVSKEAKKKKQIPFVMTKQKLAIIAVGLVLVLFIGFMAKDTLIYAMSPEKHTLLAIHKTYKSVSKDLEKISSTLVGKIDQKKSYTSNMGLMINNVSHTDPWANQGLYMFSGMGIELASSMDIGKKESQLSGKTIYNGKDFLTLNAKLDNKELLVNIPEIYRKAFMLPSKDLGKQWNDSNLARLTGNYIDESLDISFSELIDSNMPEKMDTRTEKAYLNAFKAVINNAIYEKNGQEYIPIGGKDKKCNKTTVILRERDIKEGLLQLIDAIKDDNRLEQWKDTLRSTSQAYVVYEFEEGLNELRYEINEYLELDRIIFDVYTNNGELVKVDFKFTPDSDYQDETIKLTMELLGDKSQIDDFRFEITVGEYEDAKILVRSKGNHGSAKKQFTNDTTVTFHNYGNEFMRLSSQAEIDLSKNKDNFKYDLDLRSEDINLKLNTEGDFTSSSKKTDYNLYDIRLTAKDYYDDAFTFDGSLNLSWEEGARDISNLKDIEKLSILEIGEYDIYDIISAVESNFYNIVTSLGLF